MLYQLVSIVGALLILAAYLALQCGWMGRENRRFNILNFVGSLMLTGWQSSTGVLASSCWRVHGRLSPLSEFLRGPGTAGSGK